MTSLALALICLLGGCRAPLIPQGSGIAATCICEPAVVSIYTWQPRGLTGARAQGTGFCVAPNEVVTNLHVIEGATSAAVRFADGQDRVVEAVVGEDLEADLVLLRLRPGGREEAPLCMTSGPLQIGQSVRIIGSPDGAAQTEIEGRVASHIVSFDVLDEAILLSTSVAAGMSGSPVLDQNCGVVGILSRGTNVAGQAYMVPAHRFRKMQRFKPMPLASWSQWKARQPSHAGRVTFGAAAVAFEGGDAEDAIRLLHVAIEQGLPPAGHATAWYVIGDAHVNLGRNAEATRAYERALTIRPRHALSHAALALALRRQGRYGEALAAYDHALDLIPTLARFHVGKGWTLMRLGRAPEARAAFRLGTRLAPQGVAGWTGLATADLAAGDAVDARDHALRATRLGPREAKSWWVLATAHQRLGAHGTARAAWRTGLALAPDEPRARFELGRCALASGDLPGAEAQLARLRANNAPAAAALANALAALMPPR